MIQEKAAGFIVFRNHPKSGLQYLVLYHRGNYWNFPKGGVEPGESELETALRELKEETGVKDVKVVDGFRQQTQFFFKGDEGLIKKDFVLYLAQAPMSAEVITSDKYSHHEQINGYAWFDFKNAMKVLKFKNLKEILKEADSFINSKIKK
ncbi:MAG: NUDIX domain-containing protein [Patescibacteria group bacterium]